MAKNKPTKPITLPQENNLIPFNTKVKIWILALVSFALYFNSLFNQYAFDDAIVIEKNEYVQRGIKGIPKILSSDVYESFYKQMGGSKQELSGGRYRPLSVVTFAIENQFVGDNSQSANQKEHKGKNCWDKNDNKINDPSEDTDNNGVWNEADCKNTGAFLRHLMNVLFYVLSVICIFIFLKNYLFKPLSFGPDLAFITTFLFAIHPIHTEAIANVKSRDEILSLLFIGLTFIQSFKYLENKKAKTLFSALACFFLALLSKEYAFTLLVLLPLSFYIFKNYTAKDAIKKTIPFLAVFVLYALIRIHFVGAETIENKEILNNPFLYATSPEKWATKLFILSKYLILLIFPHPLSADYSYNQIPYKTFADPLVWLSIIINIAIIIAGFILLKRRHLLAFAISFYLLNLLLISNLVFDIGATMGERLVYHSSLGFCIAAAFFILKGIEKLSDKKNLKRMALAGILLPLLILCGFKTIERNSAWKNDITLFTTDVKVAKNSILANGNAGARYIDLSEMPENKEREKELLEKAITYLKTALELHPKYVNGYLNLGLAYYKLKNYEKAEEEWTKAKEYFPNNPFLASYFNFLSGIYLNKGFEAAKTGNKEQSIAFIEKACLMAPNNAESWYNLGGVYFTFKEYTKAKNSWEKTLEINPNHEMAKKGMMALPR